MIGEELVVAVGIQNVDTRDVILEYDCERRWEMHLENIWIRFLGIFVEVWNSVPSTKYHTCFTERYISKSSLLKVLYLVLGV